MIDKDGSETRVCLRCSCQASADSEYCPTCAVLTKEAAENTPSTLRESIEHTASKFQIPKSRKLNDKAGVFTGVF
jgi:hypothetical protein